MKEKAAKKQSFLNRKRAEWKEMKLWNGNELCKVDWIVSILILTVLFFTCVHSDVKLTGNRSFLMYKHFSDFYQASYEQSGGYWANYLPSTFIAYAIWNLPLYLTGHAPEAILTNSFVNLMWYKLLPVIVYFITAQLIYHIGKEMGFGEKKSLLCKFAFLVFPMGVFSQFIFSQYDIFTVFFMVLGLYFFLKNRMWQFALAFGMACTFKYHAALYFLTLLLLKEKKIRNLIRYAVIMAIPLMVEILPNIGSEAFRRNVFGFSALDSGIFQWDQSDGSSCRLCTGLGLSEKSGGRRNSGFLGSLFLCGSELFCVWIFDMESAVGAFDGSVPRTEYLYE